MLAGPTAAPTLRWPEVSGVEELLAHEVRDPVEELLLRAVRWVGRATAAESPEDQGLFSEITLGCLTRPGMDRHTRKELVSHSQHEKKHPHLMGHLRLHSRRLVASEMKRPLAGVTR